MTVSIIVIFLIVLFLYPIMIYPFLLILLDKLIGKDYVFDSSFAPKLTILIAAYNEETMIGACIDSILQSDYPIENIQIIVGSDGSTDNTYNIVKKYNESNPNIEIYQYQRLGKNKVLNEMYKHIKNDFVMFMDADFRLRKNTIHNNLGHFIDSNVDCVMSKIVTISNTENSNSGSVGEGAYHKLEHLFKIRESRIWTTVNNIGSYTIRTKSLHPIPNSRVCDDMYNILKVSLAGKRVLYCTESIIDEVREKTSGEELNRRIRLAASQFATVKTLPSVLNIFKGFVSLFFISHKFIRYMYCLIMLAIGLLTYPLISESIVLFKIVFFGQFAFYGLALIGYFLDKRNIVLKPFSIPLFFVIINFGFLLGIVKFLFGKSSSTWERIDTRNISN